MPSNYRCFPPPKAEDVTSAVRLRDAAYVVAQDPLVTTRPSFGLSATTKTGAIAMTSTAAASLEVSGSSGAAKNPRSAMSTDAITVLKEDHREVARLFTEFQKKSTTDERDGEIAREGLHAALDALSK